MSKTNIVDLKSYKKALQEELDLEKASILALQDMGTPDCYICRECGESYFPAKAYLDHYPCSCEND